MSITLLRDAEGIHLLDKKVTLNPKHVTWKAQIPLKDWTSKKTLFLISTVPYDDKFVFPKPAHHYHTGLLKSALQKAIRRSLSLPALHLGWQFLCQDAQQLLRRLPIIILEDVCLHPNFPLIIWLLISHSKGYILTREDILVILVTIYDLGACKFRDVVNFVSFDEKEDLEGILLDLPEIDNELCTVLATILFRVSFDGMKGDMSMLKQFGILWNKRYQKDRDYWIGERKKWYQDLDVPYQEIQQMISTPPKLTETDKLMEGIDFHCFPYLLTQCGDIHSEISKSDIKEAVWWHWSSINTKIPLCLSNEPLIPSFPSNLPHETMNRENTIQIWSIIKPTWEKLCVPMWLPEPLTSKKKVKE